MGSGHRAEEDVMTTEALVIECDGHIREPPDLWETYLEPAYRARALPQARGGESRRGCR